MHKCPCINAYPTSHLCVVLHFLIFVQFMPDGWHVFLYNKLSIQFPICFQPQVDEISNKEISQFEAENIWEVVY